VTSARLSTVLVPLRLIAQGLTASLLLFLMLECPVDAITMKLITLANWVAISWLFSDISVNPNISRCTLIIHRRTTHTLGVRGVGCFRGKRHFWALLTRSDDNFRSGNAFFVDFLMQFSAKLLFRKCMPFLVKIR
jgi:hypothetical protein